jgi:uncharacterized protein YdaT
LKIFAQKLDRQLKSNYFCGVFKNNQSNQNLTEMKSYQKRSRVLTIANALTKKGYSFGDAQRKAWEIVRCICEMKKSEVVVRFFTEGETEIPQQRTASLAPAFLPYTTTTTESKPRKKNPLQITFFDTTKNGFRSFTAERFVSFASAPLAF